MKTGHYKSTDICLGTWHIFIDVNGEFVAAKWDDNILRIKSRKDLKTEKRSDWISVSFNDYFEAPLEATDIEGINHSYKFREYVFYIEHEEIRNAKRRLQYKRRNDKSIMNEPLFPIVSSSGNRE